MKRRSQFPLSPRIIMEPFATHHQRAFLKGSDLEFPTASGSCCDLRIRLDLEHFTTTAIKLYIHRGSADMSDRSTVHAQSGGYPSKKSWFIRSTWFGEARNSPRPSCKQPRAIKIDPLGVIPGTSVLVNTYKPKNGLTGINTILPSPPSPWTQMS